MVIAGHYTPPPPVTEIHYLLNYTCSWPTIHQLPDLTVLFSSSLSVVKRSLRIDNFSGIVCWLVVDFSCVWHGGLLQTKAVKRS